MTSRNPKFPRAPVQIPSSGPPQVWPVPRPPYPGPPPIPDGVKVNPQQWQAGAWYYNPAYNPAVAQAQHVPWIPGPAWTQQQHFQHHQQQQHQQQQQQGSGSSFNPYKRPPREPSAEYLATELLENPLGLTNMIPAERSYASEPAPPETPWTWNPMTLSHVKESSPNAESAKGQERQSTESTPPTIQQNGREARSGRSATEPIPVTNNNNASDSLPVLDRPLDRPRAYPRSHESSSPAEQRFPHTPERTQALQPQESFTSRRELQPTFSAAKIVRTPEHYQTPSPSRNASRNGHTSHVSVDSHLATRMERMTTSSSDPSHLHPSVSGVQNLSDEPMSMLSPLMIANTPKNGTRAIARHATVPNLAPLTTIQEAAPSTNPRTPSRHASYPDTSPARSPNTRPSSRPTSRHGSPQRVNGNNGDRIYAPAQLTPPNHIYSNSNGPAQYAQAPHYDSIPTPPRQSHDSSRVTQQSHQQHQYPQPQQQFQQQHPYPYQQPKTSSPQFPDPSARRLSNPLPPPPMDVRYSIPPTPQELPPQHYKERIRKGYWNQRGDHLTVTGYLVYAPPDKAFPPELRDYPKENEGYKDQIGSVIPWMERPELPESLPRYGQPPMNPYESFISYEYRQ